eukprot:6208900-Pleurochrysis_carterae.AAC.3
MTSSERSALACCKRTIPEQHGYMYLHILQYTVRLTTTTTTTIFQCPHKPAPIPPAVTSQDDSDTLTAVEIVFASSSMAELSAPDPDMTLRCPAVPAGTWRPPRRSRQPLPPPASACWHRHCRVLS